MKIKRKYASARERIRKRYPELFEPGANEIGIASDYFNDIKSLKSGQLVVLICRVSASDQARSKNLRDQVNNLEHEMDWLGLNVIRTFREVASGLVVTTKTGTLEKLVWAN